MLNNAKELIDVSTSLHIEVSLLDEKDAQEYIKNVLLVYKPFKTEGHLGIGGDKLSLPTEKNEFIYSHYLKDEPVFIFFGQESTVAKKTVVKIMSARKLGTIMENSYGMEYFVSNEKMDYLIAINWYAIEISGTAIQYLSPLKN